MASNEIVTALLLGLVGGITPGPIILLSFSEIVRCPECGLRSGGMYLFFAGLTEGCIGLFLVSTAGWLEIPPIVFHVLAVVGVAMLVFIAFRVSQIRRIKEESQRKVKIRHIVALMLLNGPLWLFWISVCVPAAFRLAGEVPYGEYLFVVVFELAMVAGMGIILLGFHSFRRLFSNEKVVGRTFMALAALIFLVAAKILFSEASYVYHTFSAAHIDISY